MFDIAEDRAAISDLQDLAEDLIKKKLPPFERLTLLRSAALGKGLSIRDGELFQIFAAARTKSRGISGGERPHLDLDVSEESWLWDQLIAEETLNLVTSLQKVGKSSFISAFLGALTHGSQEYVGHSIKSKRRPIIIVGTDQPLRD